MKNMVSLGTVALIVCVAPAAAGDTLAVDRGTGWTITHMDLDVGIEKDDPSMTVAGTMRARLDVESSDGPTFAINLTKPAMRWVGLEGPKDARTELNRELPDSQALRLADVHLARPAKKGDEIELRFDLELVDRATQLVARPDIALASWVEGWYPSAFTGSDYADTYTAKRGAAPGTTKLDMPGDWIAISDGALAKRERRDGRTIEVWDLANRPGARGLAAASYTAAERQVGGRTIRIYLLGKHVMSVDRLAELLAASLAAQEARLGPFPFAGYGVAEVPDDIDDWGAASQQTFIMATSNNFDWEHGNLPLWAHEMCHGWWGNTVGASGPGRKVAGEALAQYGAVISVETLEGTDAMNEFLDFSRSGYNNLQCAQGYFRMVDWGHDYALATMGDSEASAGLTHNLADSKGMWMYHMLRYRVGDERFFATLRGLIDRYAGRDMSLDDLRAAFIAAAPDQRLEEFFSMWLDRTGAPRFDLAWTEPDGGRAVITLTQAGGRNPFRIDVTAEIAFADGSTTRREIAVRDRETKITVDAPETIRSVTLDPDHRLLIWRSSYNAAPEVDGVRLSATAPWLDPDVYAGEYYMEQLDVTVDVYRDEKGLWTRVGEQLIQMYPYEPHRFMTDQGWVTFQVANGRAEGFLVEFENGTSASGVRVEQREPGE
jgi:aminopeptidase N